MVCIQSGRQRSKFSSGSSSVGLGGPKCLVSGEHKLSLSQVSPLQDELEAGLFWADVNVTSFRRVFRSHTAN